MMDSSHFPISTEALQAGLPHRKPMVWIRKVLSATAETGRCQVMLEPGSNEFDEHGIRQSSLIEWMAQGFGFAHFAYSQVVPEQVFLAHVQNVEYCDSALWHEFKTAANLGTAAIVEGRVIRTLGPISLIESEIFWQGPEKNVLLARGQLKLFKGDAS